MTRAARTGARYRGCKEAPARPTNRTHRVAGVRGADAPYTVSDMLKGAGFERITFERFDTDICIGRNLDEAIEFAMALGPAGEIIRLAGVEGERRRPQVVGALREALSPYVRGDGVWAPSSTWFISARNPQR